MTVRALRWAGREQAPAGYQGGTADRVDAAELLADAGPQVAPPRRLTAAQGGVVLTESVRPEHKAAWLLGQAQHEAVALEGEADAPTLRWLGGHGAADNAALRTMFDGRETIELGAYDRSFASGWKMVGAELEAWRSSCGLWSEAAERRRRWAIGIGIVLLLVGAADAFFSGFRWSLSDPSVVALAALCVPFGVGAGLVTRAWELRVRTPEGSARFVDIEAFRRFLATAEAADVERAAEAGLLHEHLAWAVALGESEAWRRAVESSTVEPGTRSYDPGFLYLAASLSSTTSASATAPSSSGSGGGGVGGGGGGGGGGSW